MTYSLIILDSNIKLSWPYPFTGGTVVSDINDIAPNSDNHTLTLPSAKLVPIGTSLLFNNVSAYDFSLLNNEGVPIGTIIIAGEIRQVYLINSNTDGGIWRMIPFGEGSSPISTVSASSSNNSINISPGSITSPGGNFNFKLSDSLQNINLLNATALPGFTVIKDINPLLWKTTTLTSGKNINITNGDGINDSPIFNLNESVSELSSLEVGNFYISGASLTTTETNGSLQFSSKGTGVLDLNNINFDTDSNITNVKDITVSGAIKNPAVAAAQCFFYDNNTVTNNIIVQSNYNIASVTGGNGSYVVTFTKPFNNGNYTVILSLCRGTQTIAPFMSFFKSRSAETVIIYTVDTLGNLVTASDGVSIVIFST